jgi:hypothetical protein
VLGAPGTGAAWSTASASAARFEPPAASSTSAEPPADAFRSNWIPEGFYLHSYTTVLTCPMPLEHRPPPNPARLLMHTPRALPSRLCPADPELSRARYSAPLAPRAIRPCQNSSQLPLLTALAQCAPLFSSCCKLLLPQPQSIDAVANCPGGVPSPRSYCYPAFCISPGINRSENSLRPACLHYSQHPAAPLARRRKARIPYSGKTRLRKAFELPVGVCFLDPDGFCGVGAASGRQTFDSGSVPPLC